MVPDTSVFGAKFICILDSPVMHRNEAFAKERFIGTNIVPVDAMFRMANASSGVLMDICENLSVLPEKDVLFSINLFDFSPSAFPTDLASAATPSCVSVVSVGGVTAYGLFVAFIMFSFHKIRRYLYVPMYGGILLWG